jgi:hypothetical protein
MRAMQCTHFRTKIAKNDLKPTGFLKRNFYFETEGVSCNSFTLPNVSPSILVQAPPFQAMENSGEEQDGDH